MLTAISDYSESISSVTEVHSIIIYKTKIHWQKFTQCIKILTLGYVRKITFYISEIKETQLSNMLASNIIIIKY